jgi:hypothetical protein
VTLVTKQEKEQKTVLKNLEESLTNICKKLFKQIEFNPVMAAADNIH